jgi:hypothetical protein
MSDFDLPRGRICSRSYSRQYQPVGAETSGRVRVPVRFLIGEGDLRAAMSLAHQITDIAVGGLIAGLSTFLLAAVTSASFALSMGAFFAAMYYFSRNPWGVEHGHEYNEAIDDVYDRILP